MIYFTVFSSVVIVWLFMNTIIKASSFFKETVASSRGLLLNIEGLRGFLAFAVFVHHAFISRAFLVTGRWGLPENHLLIHLGQGGVAMFFIVTAFLFWGKVLSTRGHLKLQQFFNGRVRRLGPLYWAMTFLVFLITAVGTGFQVQTSLGQILLSVGRWLAIGFLGMPNINGYPSGQIVAFVFWSLQYEWFFYLALPVLMHLLRIPRGKEIALIVSLLLIISSPLLESWVTLPYFCLFAGGIIAATLWHTPQFRDWEAPAWLTQAAFLGSVLGALFFNTAYTAPAILLYSLAFLALLKMPAHALIARILQSYPSRVIGLGSYSIYMVHGIVLFCLLGVIKPYLSSQREMSDIFFLIFTWIAGIVVVIMSLLLFRFVEHPFFRKNPIIFRLSSAKTPVP